MAQVIPQIRASESDKWYYPDGTPCPLVPYASGEGLRATTLRDARKLGLLRSVTSHLDTIRKPYLERWKCEQYTLATATLPEVQAWRDRLLDDEEFFKLVTKDAEAHMRNAAERGTAIHGAVERRLNGDTFDYSLQPWAETAMRAIKERTGVDPLVNVDYFKPEFVVVNKEHGYAGRIDILGEDIIIDVKTRDFTAEQAPKITPYETEPMQLAAYAIASGRKKIAGLYLSRSDSSIYGWVDYTDRERIDAGSMFLLIAAYNHIRDGDENSEAKVEGSGTADTAST